MGRRVLSPEEVTRVFAIYGAVKMTRPELSHPDAFGKAVAMYNAVSSVLKMPEGMVSRGDGTSIAAHLNESGELIVETTVHPDLLPPRSRE